MKYQILEFQKELLSCFVTDKDISYLQRNSYNKIQEIRFEDKNYFSSIKDKDELIRIIIFSFLSKIYHDYSLFNQRNLNRFKEIIAYSPLNASMTQHKGIQKNQLLRAFVQSLSKLTINSNCDSQISKIMNCEAFVQQIMIVAVLEETSELKKLAFQQPCAMTQQTYQMDKSIYSRWFQQIFGINIVICDNSIVSQQQNEIFIKKSNHFLRQSYSQQLTSSITASNLSLNIETPKLKDNLQCFLESIVFTEQQKLQESKVQLNVFPEINKSISINSKDLIKKRPKRKTLLDVLCCCGD